MIARITDFSSSPRGKWIVIVLWLALTAVLVPLAPTDVYVVLPDGTSAYDRLPALGELTAELAAQPGVASVTSAAYPFGLAAGEERGVDPASSPGPEAVAGAIRAIPAPIK